VMSIWRLDSTCCPCPEGAAEFSPGVLTLGLVFECDSP
jgi:hypothetical protein